MPGHREVTPVFLCAILESRPNFSKSGFKDDFAQRISGVQLQKVVLISRNQGLRTTLRKEFLAGDFKKSS